MMMMLTVVKIMAFCERVLGVVSKWKGSRESRSRARSFGPLLLFLLPPLLLKLAGRKSKRKYRGLDSKNGRLTDAASISLFLNATRFREIFKPRLAIRRCETRITAATDFCVNRSSRLSRLTISGRKISGETLRELNLCHNRRC